MLDRASITPRRSVDFSGDPGHLGTPGNPGRRTPTWSSSGSSPRWNEDSPRSGRVMPELGDGAIREVIHGNYRIVYRLRHDLVEIATVFHGARLFRFD